MPDGAPAGVCWCGRQAGHSGKHIQVIGNKTGPAGVSRPVGEALSRIVAAAVERALLARERDDLQVRLAAVEARIAVLWAAPHELPDAADAFAAAVRSGAVCGAAPEPSGPQDGGAGQTEAQPPEPGPAPAEPDPPLVPIRKDDPIPPIPFRRPHRARDEQPPPPAAPGLCHCGRPKGHTGRHVGVARPAAPPGRPEARDPPEPQDATYDQVARWAGERGIAFLSWDDLPRVNRQRERLGLPEFRRWFARNGVRFGRPDRPDTTEG